MYLINYIIDLILNSIWISLLVASVSYAIIHLYLNYKGKIFKHKIITFIFLYYLASLLYVTIYRDGLFMNTTRKVNLQPLEVLYTTFQNMVVSDKIGAYAFLTYNIVGNIVWFIPLGYYLGYQFKKVNILNVLLTSFLLSLAIEAFQYLAFVGITDIDDLILNTIGGVIGYGIYCFVHRKER